jgi:cobalamin synthase
VEGAPKAPDYRLGFGFALVLLLFTLLLLQSFQPNSLAAGVVLLATAVVLVLTVLDARRRAPVVAAQLPNPELYRQNSRRLAHWTVAVFLVALVGGTVVAAVLGGGWALLIPAVSLLVILVFAMRASRKLQRVELARAPSFRPV